MIAESTKNDNFVVVLNTVQKSRRLSEQAAIFFLLIFVLSLNALQKKVAL